MARSERRRPSKKASKEVSKEASKEESKEESKAVSEEESEEVTSMRPPAPQYTPGAPLHATALVGTCVAGPPALSCVNVAPRHCAIGTGRQSFGSRMLLPQKH